MLKFIFPFFFLLLGAITLFGQGSFLLAEADLSFPRSIIEKSEISTLRSRLSEADRKEIYQVILNSAYSELNQDNTNDGARRKRALMAREAAFVLLMDLKIENEILVPLNEQDKLKLANKCLEILNNINDGILVLNGWTFYNDWQLRTKELVHFLIAYDLLKGNENLNVDLQQAALNIQKYVGKLFTLVKDTYPSPLGTTDLEFFSFNLNNHGVMISSTLGLAAIVLADLESEHLDEQPSEWINAAMWNLDNTLWKADGIFKRVSEPGLIAGYAEGPNYFDYGFENAFPFLRAMWNFLPDEERPYTFYEYNLFTGQKNTSTRSIQNPWYDENYDKLFDWAINIRMPDGRSPSIHDSYLGFKSAMVALSGKQRHNVSAIELNNFGPWCRTQFLATDVENGSYDGNLFLAYPNAGSLIFRNTFNNPSGMYLHVIAKNGIALEGAKAHHQADVGSFQLYFNQTDLVIEGGFPGADQRNIINTAQDHNVILVNGQGPSAPNGEFIDIQNEAYIETNFDLPSLDFGKVRASYLNTEIDRKFFYLHNRYFIIIDEMKSANQNMYTFQLHGQGFEGASASDQEGSYNFDKNENLVKYQVGENKLLAKSISNVPSTQTHRNDSIAIQFHQYQYISVHEHQTIATNKAQFITILKPGLDYELDLDSEVINNNFGYFIDDDFKTFCFTQYNNEPVSITKLGTEVKANGLLNLIGTNQNKFKFAYIESGDSLIINNELIYALKDKVDLAIEKTSAFEFEGYISGSTTLRIHSDSSLVSDNSIISSITYNPMQKLSIIKFAMGGNFKLSKGEAQIVSLDQPILSKDFNLFPNPIEDFLNLNIHLENQGKLNFGIYNLEGKLITAHERANGSGLNTFKINMAALSSGAYILKLNSADAELNIPFLKI